MSVHAHSYGGSSVAYDILFIFLVFVVVVVIIILLPTFLFIVVVAFNRIIFIVVGRRCWPAWRRAGCRYVIFVDFLLRVEWLVIRARIAIVVAGHDVDGIGGKSGALELKKAGVRSSVLG
jgi:hypothetical protein